MTAALDGPAFAVVAVDGSEEGYAAVAFAAREAQRHGVSLQLVHVVPGYVPVGPLLMIATDEGIGAYASESMASAMRVVEEVAPEVPAAPHVLAGGRVSEIVHLAENACFVVVGRRAASALDRAWAGGTLDGVASRARCPVFVVPSPSRDRGAARLVVAGFKGPDHAAELFDAAFDAADGLAAELEIVHAWKLPTGYDDMIARRVSEPAWNRDQKAAIRTLVAPWHEAYPQVRVRVQVVHEYPVHALVEASRQADRLVLGRPVHGAAVHHLGRTARGALRFAQCPIEVVPAKPPAEPTTAPLAVESVGGLTR